MRRGENRRPDWVFRWDHDAGIATETRKRLLAELTDTDSLFVCGHYPGSGIGHLRTESGRVSWFEASE
jgi:hypothetical protein